MPTITEIGHRQFKLFINNNNFQLLIIQYVPATVLNTLSALAYLILTNAQDGYCYYNHFTIEGTEDQRGK